MIRNTVRKYAQAASPTEPTRISRFYKNVTLGTEPLGYTILLDGRALKAPNKNKIFVKHSRTLALLACAEWELTSVLKSHTLPITSIIVRADSFTIAPVDSKTANTATNDKTVIAASSSKTDGPKSKSTVSTDQIEIEDPATLRAGVIEKLLNYVHTDSVCYHQDYPSSFVELQNKHWMPLLELLKEKYTITIKFTHGITPIKQDAHVIDTFRSVIESYTPLKLAAFEKAVLHAKSFIIGFCLMEELVDVEEAAVAARLEQIQQIKRWGECQDAHDVEREEMRKQLGAARVCLIN